MSNYIATHHVIEIGSDFTGAAPDVDPVYSSGVRAYIGCTAGGLIEFDSDAWVRVSTILLSLDGTSHGLLATDVRVNLFINAFWCTIKDLSNQDFWVYDGPPLILPPASRLQVICQPTAISLVRQSLYVTHETYRYAHEVRGI